MCSVVRVGIAVWLTMLTCWGCASSRDALKNVPDTISSVKPAKGLSKKLFIGLTQTPPSAFGRRAGDLFLKTLADAIGSESSRLNLVTSQDPGWPADMKAMEPEGASRGYILELAQKAREAGFAGWAFARIENMEPETRKTGLFWFRKDRYFINLQLTLSVYDAFTGAKTVDEVVETSTTISEDDFNDLKSGATVEIENLNEDIVDIATDMGEHAAEVLDDQPWKAGVIRVQGNRIFLSAGSGAGLKDGQRLDVFEGRRLLEGQNGEQFIVPGVKVGEIEIVHVAAQKSEARDNTASGATRIQAGDIAVAVR